MEIQELYNIFKSCNNQVCTDTRKVEDGALFFALKGGNFNGNKFAVDALSKGCKYAVVDEVFEQHPNLILVNDVLATLQKLANYHRKQFDFPFLGITGSNGKTTTKELTAAVLAKKFNVLFTEGNLNNHIGVPLTLLKVSSKHDFAIIEMGANHQGEIKALCEIAEPDYGLITNIGKAHIEGFGGVEGIRKGKTEMFRFLNGKGTIFINCRETILREEVALYRGVVSYGTNDSIDVESVNPGYQLSLVIREDKKLSSINTQLVGAYNTNNVLTAYTLGSHFGVDSTEIKEAIENYIPSNNRSQLQSTPKGNTLVLDAYNANPSSMKLAIEEFYSNVGNKGVLILGAMKELGDETEKEHLEILKLLNSNTKNFLVGPEFSQFRDQFPFEFFNTTEDVLSAVSSSNLKDCTVLIKGSRSMRLEEVSKIL